MSRRDERVVEEESWPISFRRETMITVKPLPSSVLAQFSVDGIPDWRHVIAGNPREKLGISVVVTVLSLPRLSYAISILLRHFSRQKHR